MSSLRGGEAEDLFSVRFGKIVAEGISRLAGPGNVTVFQGDITVQGDFIPGGTVRRPTARRAARVRIPPEDLTEVSEYFVRPPDFDAGVGLLGDRNLIILSGPAKTGRYTRALMMLQAVLRRNELSGEVFRLNGSVVGNMTWRVPQSGCGLLVVDEGGKHRKSALDSVGDPWLTYASEQLAKQHSYLVVVTGPVRGTLTTATRRADFVLDGLELPEPMKIVRHRTVVALPWLTDVDDRLAGTDLAEVLADRDDPGFAARAAAAVVDALRADADLDEAVARLDNPGDQVREWLEREPELDEISFVMATAVLEGASYLNIADAAVKLYRQISGSSATMEPRYQRDLNEERGWIERIGRPDDPDGGSVLRFKHARLRPFVLSVIWFEFDGARAKILSWLTDLAEHTDVEVRARAAQAAGILAGSDFEHGVHSYLLSWAAARSARLRQSAAHGLNVAGTVGRHDQSAWSYVEHWAKLATSGASRAFPATAALAAGGPLGVRNPDRALRVLHALLRNGGWDLLEPVALSTQVLIEAGCGDQALDALLDWTGPRHSGEPVVKALLTFAYALRPEEPAAEWPVLMRTADRHRKSLPELWGRALDNADVRPLAVDALHDWVRIADRDPSARFVVLDVIAGIADRGDRDFHRLCHVLDGWALDEFSPSEAALEFHQQLVKAGEEC